MLDKIDMRELYSTRLLVIMETAPQSDKYRQVILDPKRFKLVSDAVCGGAVPEGMEEERVEIFMSKDTYDLPDLKEIEYAN